MDERTGKTATGLCLALVAAYVVLLFATASDYGVTWDQPQDWYTAERNLRFLLTMDPMWLDFHVPVDFTMGGENLALTAHERPWDYQNLGNLLAVAGSYLIFEKLHLADPVTAHFIPNFIMMAAALVVMFFFMRKHFGVVAALVAMFSFAFQPRLWAHTHFNTKDIPFAIIMMFTLLAAGRGATARSAGWIVTAAALLGCAGSAKPNAVIIPVIIAAWYPFLRYGSSATEEIPGDKRRRKEFIVALFLSPIIAAAVYVVLWPFLWADPIGGFALYVENFMPRLIKEGNQLITLATFFVVQPPAVLLFGAVGVVVAVRGIVKNRKRELFAFLLLWCFVPVLRVLLPRHYNFDHVRHFIEYAPALGALTAIGAVVSFEALKSLAQKRSPLSEHRSKILAAVIVAVPFITWPVQMVRIHPYEIMYYNFTLGGADGIEKICGDCGFATDYWGSSYRQGIEWLNENAPEGSTVVVPVAGQIVRSVRSLWMRPDIKVIETPTRTDAPLATFVGNPPPPNIYIMYITRKTAYGDLVRNSEMKYKTAHEITVDGVVIMRILQI